jgi:hypothetical protein
MTLNDDSSTIISTSERDLSELSLYSRVHMPFSDRIYVSQHTAGTDSEHLALLGSHFSLFTCYIRVVQSWELFAA